jgi:hypothetical protein
MSPAFSTLFSFGGIMTNSNSLVYPKQLLENNFFKKQTRPMREHCVTFCSLLLALGGLGPNFVQLGYIHAERYIPRRHLKRIRNGLSDIIECDGVFSYRKPGGKKCLGYRFREGVTECDFARIDGCSRRFQTAINARLTPQVRTGDLPLEVHKKLSRCLLNANLDTENARSILPGLPPAKMFAAEWQIRNWQNGQHFMTCGTTGRLYSSAASTKRDLRRFLTLDGEPVVEIDVSCCQPLLLGSLAQNSVSEVELGRYKELTEQGLLYEFLADLLSAPRAEVKLACVKFLCGAAFDLKCYRDPKAHSNPEYQRACDVLDTLNDCFKCHFPGLWRYLRDQKTDPTNWSKVNTAKRRRLGKSTQPYAVVSHDLQRLESQIVIEDCCSRMFERKPDITVLTLHDALLVPISQGDFASEVLSMSFGKRGLKPQLKLIEEQQRHIRDQQEEEGERNNEQQ